MPPLEYLSSPQTLANGQSVGPMADSQGNLKVNMASLISGEDQTNDRLKVYQPNSFLNITLAAPTTTVVKGSAGFLNKIIINKATALGVITIYDNTAASGTLIGTITMPATLLANQIVLNFDIAFTTGLTIVTSTAAQDITVSYF